jgi:hypothetical protein
VRCEVSQVTRDFKDKPPQRTRICRKKEAAETVEVELDFEDMEDGQ